MKSWILWTVLGASLSFNLLFLVAFGVARNEAGRVLTPEGSARWIGRQLDLSAEQRQAYIDYRHRIQERRQEVSSRYAGRTEEYWNVMAAPTNNEDADAIRPMIEAVHDARLELVDFETRELQEFLAKLNPEQRREYIVLARKWMQRNFGIPATR